MLVVNLMHSKLRTPKNIRFNDLIPFMNTKYYLDTPESLLESLLDNPFFFNGKEKELLIYRVYGI
jgi:hypothetical protein